jgi:hypothetical protein
MLSDHPARLQRHSSQGQERAFIPYGFHVVLYMVKDTAQAKKEGLSQLEFIFHTSRFLKHDPKGSVLKHASQVLSCWPYAHDKFEDEVFTENAQDWDKVVSRMVNPKMIKFKAMSLGEQVMTIEKSSQEALRAREEMIVAEAAEVPLASLVKDRGLPMTQDAWTREMLMIKQVQQIIDQWQDDLDLTRIIGSPTNNPNEIQTSPSGPKLIDIYEFVGLDNPEIIMP